MIKTNFWVILMFYLQASSVAVEWWDNLCVLTSLTLV